VILRKRTVITRDHRWLGEQWTHRPRNPKLFPKPRTLTFCSQQNDRHKKAQRRIRQQTTVENLFAGDCGSRAWTLLL